MVISVSVLCLLASPPPALLSGCLLLRSSPHAPPTPLLSLRHFVIIRSQWMLGAPLHRSLQQGGLLFVRSAFTPSGLGDSLPLRFVGDLQYHHHERFSPACFRCQIQSPSSMSSSSVSPYDSMSSPSLFAPNALSHTSWRSQCSTCCVLAVSARTCHLRSLFLQSKNGFAAVKCHLLPSFSSVCNLVDCGSFHGLVLYYSLRTRCLP